MKQKIVIIALFAILLSVGISNTANAHPGWHRWGGYCFMPRVRVVIPAPVVVGGYYGGGYYDGYNRGYYREAPRYRYYDRPHYGRDWDHDRRYHRGWRR